MSSGFVAAGASAEEKFESDAWAKAREKVEATKEQKTVRQGEQEGGKSLYEHLQAQKAAKQEAFEEATKLRNQFRALDDSEVEFLDTIQQREREREAERRLGDEESLDAFKKEQAAAEQEALEKALGETNASSAKDERDEWAAASRKRRKAHADEKGKGSVKVPKLSPANSKPSPEKAATGKEQQIVQHEDLIPEPGDAGAKAVVQSEISVAAADEVKPSLGLGIYDSDSD